MTGPEETLKTCKAQLRQTAMLLRAGLSDCNKDAAANSLIEFAEGFDPQSPVDVVSGYVPIGSEIDDMAVLTRFHQRGFTLGLPVVTAKATPLTFLKYRPGDRLVKGNFDVFTPEPSAAIVIPTILLVPLLAFDRSGYRLGYGGGFYDRTLALLRQQRQIKAIGLGFSGQEVDAVPHDALDQPLDAVLCENGLIEF
jgi:5-formyltetrahydrofolate cyclo-ligase